MATVYTRLVTSLETAVSNGKVLDVSKLNPDGTGSRKIDPSRRKNIKGIEGFPIVSDNYTTYYLTMQILGPEYLQYANQYYSLYGNTKIPSEIAGITGISTTIRSPRKFGPHIPNFPVHATTPNLITIPTTNTISNINVASPRNTKTSINRSAVIPMINSLDSRSNNNALKGLPVVGLPSPYIHHHRYVSATTPHNPHTHVNLNHHHTQNKPVTNLGFSQPVNPIPSPFVPTNVISSPYIPKKFY